MLPSTRHPAEQDPRPHARPPEQQREHPDRDARPPVERLTRIDREYGTAFSPFENPQQGCCEAQQQDDGGRGGDAVDGPASDERDGDAVTAVVGGGFGVAGEPAGPVGPLVLLAAAFWGQEEALQVFFLEEIFFGAESAVAMG